MTVCSKIRLAPMHLFEILLIVYKVNNELLGDVMMYSKM